MKPIAWFVLGGAALLLLSPPTPSPGPGPQPQPQPRPQPQPQPQPRPSEPWPVAFPRVVLLGDEHASLLAPALGAELGLDVVPAGIPGATIELYRGADLMRAVDAATAGIPGQSSLAIMSLGDHDTSVSAPSVATIAQAFRAKGIALAWTLPAKGPDPWAVRPALRSALAAAKVPAFDAVIIDRPVGALPDYRAWAASLAVWLRAQNLLPA